MFRTNLVKMGIMCVQGLFLECHGWSRPRPYIPENHTGNAAIEMIMWRSSFIVFLRCITLIDLQMLNHL